MPPSERDAFGYQKNLVRSADFCTLEPEGLQGSQQSLLKGSAADFTEWRLVEVWSDKALPFDVLIKWTGAQAGGQLARFTVPGHARFCMAAANIAEVTFTNRCDEAHLVRVAIATADSSIRCENHLMLSETGVGPSGDGPIIIQPPPYATLLRVDPSDPTANAGTLVTLRDGKLANCTTYALADQPSGGMPVAGIRQVSIAVVAGVRYRIDFALGV